MKRMILLLSLGVMVFSACAGLPATDAPEPVQTDVPALPVTNEAAPTFTAPAPTEAVVNPKLPAASFEAQTYVNESAGFALEYPTGWTVQEMVVGPRGTQIQFLSAPELADMATLPEGATRVTAMLYQWDPKNDLTAYVAHMKTAWEASGFTVISEEDVMLDLGLPATQLTIQTPEVQTVFLIAALGDQYLVLSGDGNLDLVREMLGRVRPVSP